MNSDHPSSFILHPSSFILHPSSFILHPSSFILPMLLPWRLRTKTLFPGRIPRLMGVVNVTPDSFSDGGKFFEPAAAVEHGLRLAAEGADVLDVGGQSTRPGAAAVAAEEELRRVLPVVVALRKQTETPISIDTSRAKVAAECLAAGAEIINDITALTADSQIVALAASSGCGVCGVHMQGTPQTMQVDPRYGDVVEEVLAWLAARRKALVAAGIAPDRIAVDPGIGFGKTTAHNLALLRNLPRFHELDCPLLIGVSRKAFIGHVLGDSKADRAAGTIGAALGVARRGVEVLRVHDVAAIRQALLLFEAAGGLTAE
jgi:dihydropteroate synthase